MKDIFKEYICRVCGLDLQSLPQHLALTNREPFHQDGYSTFNICPCCDSESGYEDSSLESTRKARQDWVERGYSWFDRRFKPLNWDPSIQQKQIPSKWF